MAAPDSARPRPSTQLHVIDSRSGRPTAPPRRYEQTLRLVDGTNAGDKIVVTQTDETWPIERREMPFGRGVIHVWNSPTRESASAPMMTREEQLRNVALSPTGNRLAAGRGELWETDTGRLLAEGFALENRDSGPLLFTRDGQSLAVILDARFPGSGPQYEIRIRNAAHGLVRTPPMIDSRFGISSGDFHPTGLILAVAGSHVRLWDTRTSLMLSGPIALGVPAAKSRADSRHHETTFSADGRQLIIEAGGTLCVLPLGEVIDATPPIPILSAWSAILSGHRIDEAGGCVPLSTAEFEQAWHAVRPGTLPLPEASSSRPLIGEDRGPGA